MYSQLWFLLAPSHLSQTWNRQTLHVKEKKNRNGHIKNINSHAINKDSISPTQEFLIRSALLKRLYKVERIRNP